MIPEMWVFHVYPEDDWIDHKVDSQDCICRPRVEFEFINGEYRVIVIHRLVKSDPDDDDEVKSGVIRRFFAWVWSFFGRRCG